MHVSFVDGLADAIVHKLLTENGPVNPTASARGVPFRRGGARGAFEGLDRSGVARVASAIAAQMADTQRQELPLEAIEI